MHNPSGFSPARRRLLEQGLAAFGGFLLVRRAVAAGAPKDMAMPMDMTMDAHHHHAMAEEPPGYVRTLADYAIPDVNLVDADGAGVPLRSALADKPVILDFIFTSCGAVCPVMSRTFSQVQSALGADRDKVRMVSISIDPEQDTPAVLKAYAGKYGAGPNWEMLTGSLKDSIAVQRAFDVYRGDKMDHLPTTFLRAGAGKRWVRLDGFASAGEILREYHALVPD